MLLVENKFILLDFPRTASFSMTRMLEKHFRTEWFGHYVPFNRIPFAYQHLPKIGFARNPIDWYTSLFGFFLRDIQQNDTVYRYVLGSNVTTERCIDLLLDPTNDQRIQALNWYTPERMLQCDQHKMSRAWMVPRDYWYRIDGFSLYDHIFKEVFSNEWVLNVNIARYEDKEEMLPYFIQEFMGAAPDSGLLEVYKAYVKTMRRYHQRLRTNVILQPQQALIRERDAEYFKQFDYE